MYFTIYVILFRVQFWSLFVTSCNSDDQWSTCFTCSWG